MGKKSKRVRSTTTTTKQEECSKPAEEQRRQAPALRPSKKDSEEDGKETKDNLRFEDPFVEEVEEEIVVKQGGDDDDDDEWEDADDDDDNGTCDYEMVQSWNPLTGEPLSPGQKLEMDPSAYKMHHGLTAEWPSLSFDFVRDDLGDHRTRFPHCLTAVMGSQADRPNQNQLTVMKLSDLARMPAEEKEDDILGEEYDKKDGDDDDDDDDDESDEEIDLDPVVEHYSIKHYGGVNRVRCMPQHSNIVATWSDAGKVNLFNIDSLLHRFAASTGKASPHKMTDFPKGPFFSYSKHGTEGYALDWSRVVQGQLVSGDCQGAIHLWTPKEQGDGYTVKPSYQGNEHTKGKKANGNAMCPCSVEDLQWSPTEATVFASGECGGYIRVFDIRAPGRSMLNHKIHGNGSDVNVISWNRLVTNLLASGSDDGVLSVWDLRKFSASGSGTGADNNQLAPLARFTPHQTPITSVEWHPTDESMVAVTDDRGAYIYDLSVEEDNDATTTSGNGKLGDIPPQLLFVHAGSEQFKEVHWHPQISSCLMTTALSGYSAFIPSNL